LEKVQLCCQGKEQEESFALLKPKTPSQLAEELGLSLPYVSGALKELEAEGLVECLTPEEKVGRIYRRTQAGEEVVRALDCTQKNYSRGGEKTLLKTYLQNSKSCS